MSGRRLAALRRLLLGEAGPAPALVLAGVAAVTSFIVTAGPLAVTAAGNRATKEALARAPKLDTGAAIAADYIVGTGARPLTSAVVNRLTASFAADLPMRGKFPPGQHWAGLTAPTLTVQHPPRSSFTGLPPVVEVAYRTGLGRYGTLVSGSLPGRHPAVISRSGRGPGSVTLAVAMSTATAKLFSAKVGSRLDLGQVPRGPRLWLLVTGIVRPAIASAAFWQAEPALAKPELLGLPDKPYWQAAVIVGPGDLAGLLAGYPGLSLRASWFFPLSSQLTTAQVPELESALRAVASGPALRSDELAAHAAALTGTALTTGLADGLVSYSDQWQATAGADSLLIVGLFAAGVILLLVCCDLAALAYGSELALVRVRGGGLAQLASRTLLRSCCVTLPALAAGAALAMVVARGYSRTAVLLGGLIAITAVAGTPLLATAAQRKPRPSGARDRSAGGRSPTRRLTVEVLVLLAAAAAIADLRLRGTGGSSGPPTPGTQAGPVIAASTAAYLSASAVLVAAAVGVLVIRIYPAPLRALARAATARRGPVGAVGLARAATVPGSSVLPAMALMLSMTLTAFAVMVGSSVTRGQVAASWAQVGGDAVITAAGKASAVSAGKGGVKPASLRAIERVPGVTNATAVYVAQNTGSLTAVLRTGRSASAPLGLAVVDPASYAALSAHTPWPGFPAGALSKPGSASAPVPILVTPGAAAASAARPGRLRLEYGGINLPVRIAGTITKTAAMPAGGPYVVLPRWAAPRLPSVPQPSTILLTGLAINTRALRAAMASVLPGGQLTIRSQVLAALASTPVLHMASSLYIGGAIAAGVLSALAVLFALAASARSRGVMLTRLAALGMSRRQALWLGITDAIPLLCVGAVGAFATTWVLAEVVGPVLGLSVFTGSTVPVLLRPTWAAIVGPLVGVSVLALAFLVADGIATGRRQVAAALRVEEAG